MPTPRLPFPTTPSEYIQAPVGGWSPDVPTWELAADQAPVLTNFQIKPGKLRVRPAYRGTADLSSAPASLAGWVPFKHGTSLLTKRLFTSGFNAEPQNVHRVGTNVPAITTAVEDAIYEITGTTPVRHAIGSGLAPSSRQVDFGGNKYALTYAAPAAATLAYNDGITGWKTNVVQLTASTSTAVTGAPFGGFDIYQWMNRLWVAGGMDPSGSTGSTTIFFYTNPIGALTNTIADWQDPHSGLYNETDIDGEHTNPIVAMASVPAGLLFLRQNSVFILRGTDPTSFTLRPVSKQAGCLDARAVVEIDSKVYFMSEQGFMVTDGTQVQNVSGALQDELYRQIATWNNGVFNSTGAWCTADEMSDGKILVSFGTYTAGSVPSNYTMIGALSAVFDPLTGAWVQMTTLLAPTGSNNLGPSIQGYGELSTLGNASVVKIEDNVAGLVASSSSSLHDVVTVGGAFTPIQAIWVTRSLTANLGSRGKIQLKRAYLDYAVSTGGPAGTISMALIDRQQFSTPSLLQTTSIAASTNTADPRQQLMRDCQSEVADLGINIAVNGTNTTGATFVNKAEVIGVGVEFSATSDMRPTV